MCLLSTLFLVGCEKETAAIEPLQNEILDNTGNVVFIMDDGWDSQYSEGYRILDKYELKGNIAINSSMIGYNAYASRNQLDEMYKRGWDVINHSHSHANLSELKEDEQRKEIVKAKEWLEDAGFVRGIDSFIYPYGAYNETTLEILEEEGFNWARTVWDGDNTKLSYEAHALNMVTDKTFEELKKRVDETIKNKTTLVLINHKIEKPNDDSGMQYDPEKFEEIVKYIAEKKNEKELNVLSVSEYIERGDVEIVNSDELFESTSPISREEFEKLKKGSKEELKLLDNKWLTVWEEDFSKLDESKWNLIDTNITWNGELQYYHPNNVQFKDGLKITGKKEKQGTRDYTSGQITTEGKFNMHFGRIEFKLKTDYKQGSFPAVWLFPISGKSLPEIDIYESIGKEFANVYYVHHWEENGVMKKAAKNYKLKRNATGWHTYAMEWRKDEIKWFVDGVHVFTTKDTIPNEPMFLRINLAIGGVWGGAPDKTTKFPMLLEVKDLKVMREVMR